MKSGTYYSLCQYVKSRREQSPFFLKSLLFAVVGMLLVAGCNSGSEMRPGLSDAVRDYSDSLLVVPDIEGFGVDTRAGRGGTILRVTNLNDSGEGSLRAALELPEPRTVLFEVGGGITLSEAIVISQPFVTVAGETAPSPGITLNGAGIIINTHNVLLRHLRIRVGDKPEGPPPTARDGLSVLDGNPGTDTFNVVIDHCSIAWAVDEGMSNWGSRVSDITYSRCIIAENLSHSIHPEGEHSKGTLIGDHARRVAVVGNLYAHNMKRNPFIKGNVSALIANNVIYNPGIAAIHFGDMERSGPSLGTVIGNVLIPGPDTARLLPLVRLQLDMNPQTRVYALNNDAGGRAMMRSLWGYRGWQAVTTYDAAPVRVRPLTQRMPAETLEWVLGSAGARPRDRDTVDLRIVETVRLGTGQIIDHVTEVGDFPVVEPAYRELSVPESPHQIEANGYTVLENWLADYTAAIE